MNNTLPLLQRTKNWMVVYTRSKWEKKVEQLLQEKGIRAYCPVVRKERQWADRKKIVEFPLFNSYLFVRISNKEELAVRETLGVVNFVYHCGKPAVVREEVINDIEKFIGIYPDLETVNIRDVEIGDKVEIKDGVFSNKKGEVLKIEGKNVVMIIENLDCALTTRVNIENIHLLKSAAANGNGIHP